MRNTVFSEAVFVFSLVLVLVVALSVLAEAQLEELVSGSDIILPQGSSGFMFLSLANIAAVIRAGLNELTIRAKCHVNPANNVGDIEQPLSVTLALRQYGSLVP